MTSTDAFITSFEQQTFNDALKFYEQALKVSEKKPFKWWSSITWCIVSAQVSMESYLNNFIYGKLTNESDKQAITDDRQRFSKKVDYWIKNKLQLSIVDNDQGWQDIKDSMEIRNNIVHEKTRKRVFDKLTITNAINAIESCRELIRRLHTADGTPYPQWIVKVSSEDYDR